VRAFVTGGDGFAGRWLIKHLNECGDRVSAPPYHEMDVTNLTAVRRRLAMVSPDVVYHLAAFTHVGRSWDEPDEVFRVNSIGTLNVLEASRSLERPPRVVVVSSAEVYGRVLEEDLPLREEAPMRPMTPYAVSKVACEFLAIQAHLGYGLDTVRVRPFNHVGPGQSPEFAVSALAKRVVECEKSGSTKIAVGNLTPRRDFTDVRDVARAYRLIAQHGEPNAVYNICSGRDLAIGELAERLIALSKADLELEVDPALQRAADTPVLRGDPTRLMQTTGWKPEIDLDETLRSVLDYWRTTLE
jgi:GDP-4-dehydro-6-deoxy-D-mannose reductase